MVKLMPNYMRQGKGFYKELFLLAFPLVLQNIIMTSLAMVDTLLIGTLGEAPMAGLTVAKTPIFVMDLFIFGLQSGSTVLISQYWGKKDRHSINRVIGIGFYVAAFISMLLAIAMGFFPNQAMSLFCNDANLVAIAASYIKYIGVAYVFHSITAIYIAAHRGMGNPKLGVCIFGAAMILDTFLSWVLIFGKFGAPALGVEGGAIGSLIACVMEFIAMMGYSCFNKRFKLMPRYFFKPGAHMVKKYIKYSSPVVLNEALWGTGTALFPTIMGHMENSQEILAGYTIFVNIADLCTIAIFAVAGTSAIIIGREIGKGNSDKVYEMGAALTTIAVFLGLIMGGILLVMLFAVIIPSVYPIFSLSKLGANTATMMMIVFAITLAFRSFNCTNIVGVLRGGGDVRAATLIDTLALWCVAVPLAALFGLVFKLDILWVYLAMAADTIIKFIVGLKRFRSKKWINDVTGVEV